ncbi:hypothetical protein L1987_72818 [Smallanthus sonchifolius]|uniref:Uncharacterized protein n=1 Tax=Smallanthus sonchifolius TaxID=185202 RepID=A0ACB9AXM1_9ASTR|nr:hypothetical protein L1987_72818 [Smallanthus sonchifolius]
MNLSLMMKPSLLSNPNPNPMLIRLPPQTSHCLIKKKFLVLAMNKDEKKSQKEEEKKMMKEVKPKSTMDLAIDFVISTGLAGFQEAFFEELKLYLKSFFEWASERVPKKVIDELLKIRIIKESVPMITRVLKTFAVFAAGFVIFLLQLKRAVK